MVPADLAWGNEITKGRSERACPPSGLGGSVTHTAWGSQMRLALSVLKISVGIHLSHMVTSKAVEELTSQRASYRLPAGVESAFSSDREGCCEGGHRGFLVRCSGGHGGCGPDVRAIGGPLKRFLEQIKWRRVPNSTSRLSAAKSHLAGLYESRPKNHVSRTK